MRKLIESTLVSLDGVIESPERWAIFDEASQLSMQELDNYDVSSHAKASSTGDERHSERQSDPKRPTA
jgi:hypothetical protein